MKTWKEHLESLTTSSVVSANRAVDYLVGEQIRHLEDILNETPGRGIKDWKERGVEPVINNLTMKIISRSAKSYSDEPKRAVIVGETASDEMSGYYNDLLTGDGQEYIDALDIYSRLLKVSLFLVQFEDETQSYTFSVLHRGNCDVSYNAVTRTIESLIYTAEAAGPAGGKMFHYWSATEIVDIEVDENGMPSAGPPIPHPYGIIPVAILRDVGKPIAGFWPSDAWDELIRLNEIVNEFQTEMRFASKRQAFPSRITNAEVPAGQVEGVDSITEIKTTHLGEQPIFYEHVSPSINLDSFRVAYADLIEEVADNWGVKLEIGGTATADSGFQLIVMENNSLELRKKRLKSARTFEADLFRVISTIEEALQKSLRTDMSVVVDFAEPALAIDIEAESNRMRLDFAAGLVDVEDWLRWKNPDMSKEDLDAKVIKLRGISAPDFTEATGN